MIKTIDVKVGCLDYYPKGCTNFGWGQEYYTSGDPYKWRTDDVEHILDCLARVAKKHPIKTVDFLGKEVYARRHIFVDDLKDGSPLQFRVTYETKVPKTTFKINKETIKHCLLMELL